ncbi:DNA repair exonuclease SbcCD ATPase subunit [Candidatus Fervidibacteria bacterium JGI MDM2 JNZ-1-D12]
MASRVAIKRIKAVNFRNRVLERFGDKGLVLKDGLNIICGDNDVGKSTIALAILIGLFEQAKTTSQAIRREQSWGAREAFTIEMELEVNGETWRLRKDFEEGRVELDTGKERLRGHQRVQQKIEEALGLSTKHEALATICVKQEELGRLEVEGLSAALESVFGLGIPLDRLQNQVTEERRRMRREVHGRPAGEIAQVERELEEQEKTLKELKAQIAEREEKEEKLAELRVKRDKMQRELEEAEQRLETLRPLIDAMHMLSEAEKEERRIKRAIDEARQLINKIKELDLELEYIDREIRQLENEVEQRRQYVEKDEELKRVKKERDELGKRIEQLNEVREKLSKLKEQLTDTTLEQVRQARSKLEHLLGHRKALEESQKERTLAFQIQAQQDVVLRVERDGEPTVEATIQAGGGYQDRARQHLVLQIGNWVTLNASIQDRAQEQMDNICYELNALMQQYDADDESSLELKLEQLEELWREQDRLEREQKAILAGRDEASLRDEWKKLEERAKELERELEEMQEFATDRKGLARREQELEKKRQIRVQILQERSEKQGKFNAILNEQDTSDLNELEENLSKARQRVQTLQREVEKLKQQHKELAELSEEKLKLELQQREREYKDLWEKISEVSEEIARLEGELERLPTAEQVNAEEEIVEELRARKAALEHREKVLRALEELLPKVREQLFKELADELTKEMSELLKQITGGRYSEVRYIPEKQCFSLVHPEKGNVLEEHEMNPGVRDPLYFAARIALAKRLTNGKPFILLDEPFANLDEERVRGMIQVCQWLATEHGMQIILLSKERDLPSDLKSGYIVRLPS